MLIAVTGATGFLGRHFMLAAARAGYAVRALIRSPQKPPGVEVVQGDLEDREALRALVRGADVVVHLAAFGVQCRDRRWEAMIRVNAIAPLALLEEAAATCVRQVVAAGTCLEYAGWGRLPDAPWNGDAPRCDESSSLETANPYGATKAAGGLLLRARAQQLSLRLRYLRIASLYGPDDDPGKLLPAAVRAAIERRSFEMTPGEQVREWLHVDDAAGAVLAAAAGTPASACEVINVGTAEGCTLLQAVQTVFVAAGAPLGLIHAGARPFHRGEAHHLVMSVARAQEFLGPLPVRPAEEGLRELVSALRRSGV